MKIHMMNTVENQEKHLAVFNFWNEVVKFNAKCLANLKLSEKIDDFISLCSEEVAFEFDKKEHGENVIFKFVQQINKADDNKEIFVFEHNDSYFGFIVNKTDLPRDDAYNVFNKLDTLMHKIAFEALEMHFEYLRFNEAKTIEQKTVLIIEDVCKNYGWVFDTSNNPSFEDMKKQFMELVNSNGNNFDDLIEDCILSVEFQEVFVDQLDWQRVLRCQNNVPEHLLATKIVERLDAIGLGWDALLDNDNLYHVMDSFVSAHLDKFSFESINGCKWLGSGVKWSATNLKETFKEPSITQRG